jgi:hypothetical protein
MRCRPQRTPCTAPQKSRARAASPQAWCRSGWSPYGRAAPVPQGHCRGRRPRAPRRNGTAPAPASRSTAPHPPCHPGESAPRGATRRLGAAGARRPAVQPLAPGASSAPGRGRRPRAGRSRPLELPALPPSSGRAAPGRSCAPAGNAPRKNLDAGVGSPLPASPRSAPGGRGPTTPAHLGCRALGAAPPPPAVLAPPGLLAPLGSIPAGRLRGLAAALPPWVSEPSPSPPADPAREPSARAVVAAPLHAMTYRGTLRANGSLPRASSGPPMSRVFTRDCPLTPHMGGWVGCPTKQGMLPDIL